MSTKSPSLIPLTEQSVAKNLGVSRDTLRRLRKSGKLKSTRVGNAIRYLPEHIERYLKSGETSQ